MGRLTHKIITGLSILSLALLAGCGDSQPPQQIATVRYIDITTTPVDLEVELPGRTTAHMISEVRPQVGGIILERSYEEGRLVQKGDQMYQIDPALFKAAVDTAKAGLMRAEANANAANLLARRYASLVKDKAVSKQEYDNAYAAARQASAEVASAKAALDTARINLEYTKVLAPITGIASKSSVTPGALVTPGQPLPLTTVHAQNPMYVDVTQSSTDLLRLKQSAANNQNISIAEIEGAEATLILPDGTIYEEKGKLLFSEVSVDTNTGSYVIRAIFPNDNQTLLQNLFVRLKIKEAMSNKAVVIPQKLVSYDMTGAAVVKVLAPAKGTDKHPLPDTKGKPLYNVVPRKVETDRVIDNQAVITAGIQPGDQVVVDGTLAMRRPDEWVFAAPFTPPAQAQPAPASKDK